MGDAWAIRWRPHPGSAWYYMEESPGVIRRSGCQQNQVATWGSKAMAQYTAHHVLKVGLNMTTRRPLR